MLQADGKQCTDKGNSSEGAYGSFGLNDSQSDAVTSCISASTCSKPSVMLIWGPPGTGKPKTVSLASQVVSLVNTNLGSTWYR